jgi:hypothetical protein
MTGGSDSLVRARTVLLDALAALDAHRDAVIVVGAQAIYLHTGRANVSLAEATKDSDLAIDTRILGDVPHLEDAMAAAGFTLDPRRPQPGTWLSADGTPVDLMVPELLGGTAGRRGARIPPHSSTATRRAVGLEAAVVDHLPMLVASLKPGDRRACTAEVASPAALLVAKLHKIGERRTTPTRLVDKDAHDVYRLLLAVTTDELSTALSRLACDAFAGTVTQRAVQYLGELFGQPNATGSTMAGRAEDGIGDPEVVSASVSLLANDLLDAIRPMDPERTETAATT